MINTTITNINDFIDRMKKGHEIINTEKDPNIPDNWDDMPKHTIVSSVPLYLATDIKDNINYATILLLCTLEDNSLCTLYHNYIIENIEEDEYVKSLPFYGDNVFINNIIASHMIADYFPRYHVDLNIYMNSGKLIKDGNKFFILGTDKDSKLCMFTFNTNIYTMFSFINYAISADEISDHDLILSITSGGDKNKSLAETCLMTDNMTIKDIALANKKTKSVACVFSCVENNDFLYDYEILLPVYPDTKYDKSKYSTTMEELGNLYTIDPKQYVSDFFWIDNLKVVDIDDPNNSDIDVHSYYAIRGTNKYNANKVFLFTKESIDKLSKLVDEFEVKK